MIIKSSTSFELGDTTEVAVSSNHQSLHHRNMFIQLFTKLSPFAFSPKTGKFLSISSSICLHSHSFHVMSICWGATTLPILGASANSSLAWTVSVLF